jgi:hypothetical protein
MKALQSRGAFQLSLSKANCLRARALTREARVGANTVSLGRCNISQNDVDVTLDDKQFSISTH